MKTKQLIARQTILDRELPPGTSIVAKGTFPCADPKRIIAGTVHRVDVDITVRLDARQILEFSILETMNIAKGTCIIHRAITSHRNIVIVSIILFLRGWLN